MVKRMKALGLDTFVFKWRETYLWLYDLLRLLNVFRHFSDRTADVSTDIEISYDSFISFGRVSTLLMKSTDCIFISTLFWKRE